MSWCSWPPPGGTHPWTQTRRTRDSSGRQEVILETVWAMTTASIQILLSSYQLMVSCKQHYHAPHWYSLTSSSLLATKMYKTVHGKIINQLRIRLDHNKDNKTNIKYLLIIYNSTDYLSTALLGYLVRLKALLPRWCFLNLESSQEQHGASVQFWSRVIVDILETFILDTNTTAAENSGKRQLVCSFSSSFRIPPVLSFSTWT